VKKGLQDSCTDGARKKAKYLLDEEEVCESWRWAPVREPSADAFGATL
jgi:hypothetical protein